MIPSDTALVKHVFRRGSAVCRIAAYGAALLSCLLHQTAIETAPAAAEEPAAASAGLRRAPVEAARPVDAERPPGTKDQVPDDSADGEPLLLRKRSPQKGTPVPRRPRPADEPAPPGPKDAQQPGDDTPPDTITEPRPAIPGAAGADPLNEVLRELDRIEERLARHDTGEETTSAQQRVIEQIERLLNQPQQPQSGSGSNRPNRNPSSSDSQNPNGGDSQKNDTAKKSEDEAEGTADGSSSKPQEGPARDSDESIREQQRRKAELASREQMVRDVWGHLPPVLRQQLLNIGTQKYLPRYERSVRKYFERLAKPAENGRSR